MSTQPQTTELDGFVLDWSDTSPSQVDFINSLRESRSTNALDLTEDSGFIAWVGSQRVRNGRKTVKAWSLIDVLMSLGAADRPVTERMIEAGTFHLDMIEKGGFGTVGQRTTLRTQLLMVDNQAQYGVWRRKLSVTGYDPDARSTVEQDINEGAPTVESVVQTGDPKPARKSAAAKVTSGTDEEPF